MIFKWKPGEWKPHIDNFLGDWTNECDDDEFYTLFMSTGPKSYVTLTNKGKTSCKLKGVMQNSNSAPLIDSTVFKCLVLENELPASVYDKLPDGELKRHLLTQHAQIKTDKNRTVLMPDPQLVKKRVEGSIREDAQRVKRMRFTFSKHVIIPESDSFWYSQPYGFVA